VAATSREVKIRLARGQRFKWRACRCRVIFDQKQWLGEADDMPEATSKPIGTLLDPMERIAEVLFGVVMTLTFTCTLAVETADRLQVRTMLIGALGCNMAWGIIDAGVYLLTRINTESRKVATVGAIREAADGSAARQILADSLNPVLASALSNDQLESMRQNLRQMPGPLERPALTKRDWLSAGGLCLLCFLSTFPIALPFIFISDARLALRVSNAVAVALLALCGYAFGYRSKILPWAMALVMVAFGAAMVGVAIALGG
jgi:VIT1/CCC1 family predicted Fe2+/Mn2+ transporter